MWAKKNSIGKEGVAKLVDDTYRYYIIVKTCIALYSLITHTIYNFY